MPKLAASPRLGSRIRSLAAAGALVLFALLGASRSSAHAAPVVTAPPKAAPPAPPEPPANRNDLTEWLEYQRALGSPSLPAVAQLFYRRGVETLRSGAS